MAEVSSICEIGKLPIEGRLFINGTFKESKSKKTWENINPFNNEILSIVHEAGIDDVNDAVDAAHTALESWKLVDAQTRAKILLRICDLIKKHKLQLAQLDAMDSGKPLKGALETDLKLCEDVFRFYAGEADRIYGRTINHQSTNLEGGNKAHFSYTRREPVGVCAQIIPWNFPLLMAAWKIAPLLAAGCSCVIKSSERTPLSLLSFATLLNEAGVPPGVVNCISGGPPTGEMLVLNNKIKKVCLTGSIRAGKRVACLAAESGLKRVSLELGGKSPFIIFEDVDVEKAANIVHSGIGFNMGEVCCASSRVYVHQDILDDFVLKLSEKLKQEKEGNPLEINTTQGPLIDKKHFDVVSGWINKAKQDGGNIVLGGSPFQDGKLFYKPTIITNLNDDSTVVKEEIFGPVVCILGFKDENDVIRRANNTHYGLSAGVMTNQLARAHRVAHQLEAGSVYINGWGSTDAAAPFGGFKSSGWGRELGPEGIDNYLETKTVVVHMQ